MKLSVLKRKKEKKPREELINDVNKTKQNQKKIQIIYII